MGTNTRISNQTTPRPSNTATLAAAVVTPGRCQSRLVAGVQMAWSTNPVSAAKFVNRMSMK